MRYTRRSLLRNLVWTALGLGALTGGCQALPRVASRGEPVKVVLMRWGNPDEQKVTTEGLKTFEERNPDVKTEFLHVPTNYYEKLQTMLAGGVGPDVFIIGAAYATAYAVRGVSADLSAYIKRDAFDIEDFIPAGVAQYRVRGGLYGLPRGLGRSGLVFNDDLFRRAGVTTPPQDWQHPGWDWQEFVETARRLTQPAREGRPPQFGFLVQPGNLRLWLSFVWSNGGEAFSADGTEVRLHEPPAVEALQFLQDLIHKYQVAPRPDVLQEQNALSLFATSRIALDFTEPFTFATRRREARFRWDCAVLPKGKAGRVPGGGGAGWVLSARSQQPEAGWRLFKWLTSKEFMLREQEAGTTTTPRLSITYSPAFLDFRLADGTPVNMRVYADNLALMRTDPQLLRWDEVNTAINRELDYLWTGRRPAREVVTAIKQAVDPLLKA
jgi:multiple sugar transport system substrate-binding protein